MKYKVLHSSRAITAILLLLSSAVCSAHIAVAVSGTGRYDVTYEYDLNGNVTALQRSGLYDNGSLKKYGLIDDLTLEYEGNMLRRVTDGCGGPYYQGAYHFVDGADGAQEYAYDGNGNTTMDLNRQVTAVGYDANNRPRLIEFEGGSSTAYLYDAAGVKRRTVHRVATERPSVPGAEPQEPELSMTRTDYCGDIIYEDSLLSRINFDGGYLSFTNNAGERLDRPAYHFYHRDHLGNNRMDIGENGAVWQICHYYPYGMLMGCSYLGESQRWKFGGKELDRVSGLDLLDFEARPYDATLGRFWRPDDLADKYHPLSPFLYCAANPLRLIDPTGKDFAIMIAPDGAGGYGHMGAVIQNKEGKYFYISAGSSETVSFFSGVSNSNHDGEMVVHELSNSTNMNDAIKEATEYDNVNSEYTDSETFKTSSKMDGDIYDSAVKKQEDLNNKKQKYRVLTNNCADIVEDIIEKGTGIDLPTGLSPKPNSNFENIRENKNQIQQDLDDKGKTK